MVLYGVLEDFLHGAGTAWGIDDAAVGEGEDAVFAQAVLEELCDVGGKGGGGFVSVEPGGDAQGYAERVLWIALHDAESGCEPRRVLKRRVGHKYGECVIEFAESVSSHPGSEVGGLHGSRASAADHEKAMLGELLADEDYFAIHGVGALKCVSAHDADAVDGIAGVKKLAHGCVDVVVVEGACKVFGNVVGQFACLEVVLIDSAVVAGREGGWCVGVVALIEAGSGVESGGGDVVGNGTEVFYHLQLLTEVDIANHILENWILEFLIFNFLVDKLRVNELTSCFFPLLIFNFLVGKLRVNELTSCYFPLLIFNF